MNGETLGQVFERALDIATKIAFEKNAEVFTISYMIMLNNSFTVSFGDDDGYSSVTIGAHDTLDNIDHLLAEYEDNYSYDDGDFIEPTELD